MERFQYFPPSSPESKYLSEGTIEANRAQVNRNPAQEELANWIRWSNEDAMKHRDGLTPESMEITGFAGWYVRNFYDRNSVLEEGFREKTVDTVKKQLQDYGGWIVITSKETTAPALLETGRLFDRMLLKIRDKMIAVHPMTQMLEESKWQNDVARELGLNESVQFLLRVGYLDRYPEPVTLRRPPNWFVKS